MTTVSLFLHGGRPEALHVAVDVCAWLAERGHVVVAPPDEHALVADAGGLLGLDGPEQAVDLVLAIGGDGTVLRATRRGVESDADVLGINLGQLGYLAEVEPSGWEVALDRYLAGGHDITARLLVAGRLTRTGSADPEPLPSALNEVVVEKRSTSTVHLRVSIDGEHFTDYVADGVIIATPTGSTAYSLSARGPIVAPTHRALLLTAVSPHSLFDRSLVLEPSSTVEVEVLDDRAAVVSVDGEHAGDLEPGCRVTVTADPRPARFVTFGERDFHHILRAKFGLNAR